MRVESMPEMVPNYEFWAGIPSLLKVKYQFLTNDFLKKQTQNSQSLIQHD